MSTRALCQLLDRVTSTHHALTHHTAVPRRLVLSPRRMRQQTSPSVRECRWSRCSAGSGGAPPRNE